MRRRYTVYRADYVTGMKEPIGCIDERRRTGREMQQNFLALLAKAREIFGEGPGEGIDIVMNDPKKMERSEGIGDAEGETRARSEDHG